MLIIGAVGGFFLRPLIQIGEPEPTAVALSEASPTAETAAVANPDAAEIMDLVTKQTLHFAGSQEAEVTIIEFSDFQ
jgi:hypothetical protein